MFEPQEFFFVIKFLYEFFLGRSMNIFYGSLACMSFYHLSFPCSNIFFVLRQPPAHRSPPPHKFSNGPSLKQGLKSTGSQ